MKWRSRSAAFFLVLSLFFTPAHALAASSNAPSPWAVEAVERAEELGFVPDALQGSYPLAISREEFAQISLHFLCAQYNYYGANNRTDVPSFLAVFLESPKGGETAAITRAAAWALLPEEYREAYGDAEELSWSSLLHAMAPFSDVEDGYFINAAYTLGIVKGRGEGLFAPHEPITRQEAAVMLERVYQLYGEDSTAPEPPPESSFLDEAAIALWAKEAAAVMSAYHVMEGTGEGRFSPTELYTREQCYATFLRLYENMPVSKAHGNIVPFASMEENLSLLQGGFWLSSSPLYRSDAVTLVLSHYGGLPHGASYDTLTLFYQEGGMRQVDAPGIRLSDDFHLLSDSDGLLTFDMAGLPCRLDLTTGSLSAL